MTLRLRLLLTFVAIVAIGLVTTDLITYAELDSYLIQRIDPQLQSVSYPVTRALESSNGIGPALPYIPFAASKFSSTKTPPASKASNHAFSPFSNGSTGTATHRVDLIPSGTIGELVYQNGNIVGKPLPFVYGGQAPSPPALPHPLPSMKSRTYIYLNLASIGPNATSYHVLIKQLGISHLDAVTAIPLTDVNQTMRHLVLLELLVTIGVLFGLSLLSWWTVRKGLGPLDRMTITAGAIADGNLSERIDVTKPRTEVGKLANALNRMLGEIEGALAARKQSELKLRRFLADASHELRTPLTTIRGYTELFDRGAKDRPLDLASSIKHIKDAARRMEFLVEDLLLLARLDQERPLNIELTDITSIVNESVQMLSGINSNCLIKVNAPGSISCMCDAMRVHQVVDNLVENAILHSMIGSAQSDETHSQGTVRVTLEDHQDYVEMRIQDSGPGIQLDDIENIFEPFYRSDYARARTSGGAGLGLAITAAIVHAHGGSIGVDPNSTSGALFWVKFPKINVSTTIPNN